MIKINRLLRAKKLRFLSESFGFTQYKSLVNQKNWADCVTAFGTGNDPGKAYGAYERGDNERAISNEALDQIAIAFGIEAKFMIDECSINEFKKVIKPIAEEFKKSGKDLPYRNNNSSIQNLPFFPEFEESNERWKKKYDYSIMMRFAEKYRDEINQFPASSFSVLKSEYKEFLLFSSVHLGKNYIERFNHLEKNEHILKLCFIYLKHDYLRPRLRLLFLMQYFEKEYIEKNLKNDIGELSEKTRVVIRDYVLKDRVKEFILELYNTIESTKSDKVLKVLREIDPKCTLKARDDPF